MLLTNLEDVVNMKRSSVASVLLTSMTYVQVMENQ